MGLREVGGTVWNTLKGGGTEKRGGETDFKKGVGNLGQGVGALNRGGTGTPLRTMMWYLVHWRYSNLIIENLKFHEDSQENIRGGVLSD